MRRHAVLVVKTEQKSDNASSQTKNVKKTKREYYSPLVCITTSQASKSRNEKIAESITPLRSIKLLNGMQNVCTSDQKDQKIWTKLKGLIWPNFLKNQDLISSLNGERPSDGRSCGSVAGTVGPV